jgi:hypothetical protein
MYPASNSYDESNTSAQQAVELERQQARGQDCLSIWWLILSAFVLPDVARFPQAGSSSYSDSIHRPGSIEKLLKIAQLHTSAEKNCSLRAENCAREHR